jgi:outer membrane lipoprotein-sorting protein
MKKHFLVLALLMVSFVSAPVFASSHGGKDQGKEAHGKQMEENGDKAMTKEMEQEQKQEKSQEKMKKSGE